MSVKRPFINNKEFMGAFWTLTEGSEDERTTATKTLLSILTEKQGESQQECIELDYTINRLLKGLSSHRKWARLGFATALKQVLTMFSIVNFTDVLELIPRNLQSNPTDSKSEISNVYLGQILAYLTLIRASRLSEAENKKIKRLTEAILGIRQKKMPLHHMCTEALAQLLAKISSEQFEAVVWPLLKTDLTTGWEKCSPDTLLLLLTANKHHTAFVDKSFLKQHWDCKAIINPKKLESLGSVLLHSTQDHPIIHPVCWEVIHRISSDSKLCCKVWDHVFYGKIFPIGPQRQYLVFELIPEALKHATSEDEIYSILSPTLIGCLMKCLAGKDKALSKAAKQLLVSLVRVASQLANDKHLITILTAFISSPGGVLFDSITKSKIVWDLVNNMSLDCSKAFGECLMQCILGTEIVRPNVDESQKKTTDLVHQQKWAANNLGYLVTAKSLSQDTDWCYGILQFVFAMGFFTVNKSDSSLKKPSAPVPADVQVVLTNVLFRILDKIAKGSGKGKKGILTYTTTLHHIVDYAQTLLAKDNMTTIAAMSPEALEAWQKMYTVGKKIKSKREKIAGGKDDTVVFELLFLHHGLQLFKDADPAMEVLEELHTCHEKAGQKKRRQSVAPKSGAEEPGWVEVIIDLLMSLLSQKSHLVRTVVNTTFMMLSPHLNSDNVQLILDVIKPGSGSEDNALSFEDEDDVPSDMEEEEEGEDEEPQDEDGSDDDSSSSEEEQEEESNGEVRQKVKLALGKAAADDSGAEDDEESSDLDDEAMFKLDAALGAVFKSMKKSKKKSGQEETQLKHYKIRCLELLEILINQSSPGNLLQELMFPLLHLMEIGLRETSQKDLGIRASKIFQLLTNTKRITSDTRLENLDVCDVFKQLMEFSKKVSTVPLVKDVARACIFVYRIGSRNKLTDPSPVKTRAMAAIKKRKQDEDVQVDDTADRILKIVEESLDDFFLKRDSRYSPFFFQALFAREPGFFWPLAPGILAKAVDSSIRIFCRTQACTLLSSLAVKDMVNKLEPDGWKEFVKDVVAKVREFLETGDKSTYNKPRYINEMLVLLQRVLSLLSKDEIARLVSPDLVELAQGRRSSCTKDGRIAISKINAIYSKLDQQVQKKTENRSPKPNKTPVRVNGDVSDLSSHGQKTDSTPRSPNDGTNGTTNEGTSSASKSKKKKRKTDKDESSVGSPVKVDIKVNLASQLAAAQDKPSKKRRKSEIPQANQDPELVKSKKQKRKSMGDALR